MSDTANDFYLSLPCIIISWLAPSSLKIGKTLIVNDDILKFAPPLLDKVNLYGSK